MPDMKQRIDKLVDIVINYSLSPDQSAGWHAPPRPEWSEQHIKGGRTPQFRISQITAAFSAGDERQANDDADRKMINEIRHLRSKHHDFNLSVTLLSRMDSKYTEAILAGPYLRAVYKREHRDAEIADYLEYTLGQYRHNKKMAYKAMGEALQLIDEYRACSAAA